MKLLAPALLVATAGLGIATGAAPVSAATVCSSDTFSWNGDHTFVPWDAVLDTGVVVPAAGPDESLVVTSATYVTYDRYPDGQSPSRAEANQQHEGVWISVGGAAVGGLTPDVPDIPPAAVTDWYSGDVSGSFGGSGTALSGGSLVIHHSSTAPYSFNETPNSVHVSQVIVVVERCTVTPDPTTTTTTPATTTTAAATTTTTAAATTTTGATTTTLAGSAGPVPTVCTTVGASSGSSSGQNCTTSTTGAAAPTSPVCTTVAGASSAGAGCVGASTTSVASAGPVPNPLLPATGSDSERPIQLGLIGLLAGGYLLLLRRRSAHR